MLLLWSLNVQVDGDQLAVGWVWPANLPPSWPQVWRLSQQVNGLFLVLPVFTEMFLWNFLSLLIILIELFSVPRITAACEVSFYLRVRIELLKNSIRSPTPWLLSKYYKLATKIILKIYMRKIHRGGDYFWLIKTVNLEAWPCRDLCAVGRAWTPSPKKKKPKPKPDWRESDSNHCFCCDYCKVPTDIECVVMYSHFR